MVFQWNLSDSKSPQVSRTLLSILADLNDVVVWIVSTRSLISKSSSSFINPLVTVQRAPITISINITFIFQSFFSIPLQGQGIYPSFHFLSLLLCGQPGQQSQQFCKFSIFCWLLLGLFIWPRLGILFVCRNPKRTDVGLCKYHLFIWAKINFLHNSKWITLPSHSCLVLYSFCAICCICLCDWAFRLSPHTFPVLLRLIYPCFDMIGSYGIVLNH